MQIWKKEGRETKETDIGFDEALVELVKRFLKLQDLGDQLVLRQI